MARWTHTDSRGLNVAIDQAIARARAGAWQSDAFSGSQGTRVADLRALALGTLFTIAQVSDNPQAITPDERGVLIDLQRPKFSDDPQDQNMRVAADLFATFQILAQGNASNADISTSAGGVNDAGWIGLAVAGVVVVGAVQVAAIYFVVSHASEVIDRQLARKEATRRMVATQAATIEAVNAHEARAPGKAFDAVEQKGFDALNQAQAAAIAADPPQGVPSSASPVGILALIVGAILGALYLFKKEGVTSHV